MSSHGERKRRASVSSFTDYKTNVPPQRQVVEASLGYPSSLRLLPSMEVSSSSWLKHDVEGTALKGLLEAFGSVFSLEEIASAYRRAGRNADLAGEILYCTQGTVSSPDNPSKDIGRGESAEPTNPTINKNGYGKPKPMKQKWRPVSGGTISSVLGKDYTNPTPASNGSSLITKPLKLGEEVLPMSELWPSQPDEPSHLNLLKNEHLRRDVEEFVYKLLGSGFSLDKDVIHQVLDQCGFDVQKGLDKLLDLSTSSNKKEKDVGESSTKDYPSAKPLLTDACPYPDGPFAHEAAQLTSSLRRDHKTCNEEERGTLQREVLTSLFSRKEEESPRRTAKVRRTKLKTRSLALGKVVSERDIDIEEPESTPVSTQRDANTVREEEEEDGYKRSLNASKEYGSTMMEYCKAAVDALIKGDNELADKFRDKVEFFWKKVREADEESSQKIFETNVHSNDTDIEYDMLVDLHTLDAKNAIDLLKYQLSSLSGIPNINRLKVVLETTKDEDATKGARRRMVMKLLEKKSVAWSEGNSEGAILIRLDSVGRKGSASAKQ